MDRINLLHLATARLRGQSVTFIPTQSVSGEDDFAMLLKLRRLRPAALDKALSRLLNEQATPEEGPE